MDKTDFMIWNFVLPLALGVYSVLWGRWLWRNARSIDPESRLYKVYRANHAATCRLFRYKKWPFEEVSEKYFKFWAKRVMVLGVVLIVFSITLGVWVLFS
jgi:hypothetical protein